jgi:hypothetical protein
MFESDSQNPAPTNATPVPPNARESADSILRRARERANGGQPIEAAPDETLQWVHDSWIGECEAAGVYSRQAPAFDYSEGPSITATLTRAEVKLLAQRHLNTAMNWAEFYAWNGLGEKEFAERAIIHDIRSRILAELLPPEEQDGFRRQIEIRKRYIASVGSEVFRCEKAEGDFWSQADAGLVSKAEIDAHKTPPFIAGFPGMPSPADGGPEPEQWSMFD